jgi:hypothetical protein
MVCLFPKGITLSSLGPVTAASYSDWVDFEIGDAMSRQARDVARSARILHVTQSYNYL